MPRKIYTAAAVALSSVLFTLGVVEILVRMFADFGGTRMPWNDRPAFYYRAEGASTSQDYYYSPEKPPGTFRVAVVGDSYTFGPYLQFTDTFPKRLEQMLNLNTTPKRAEVINHGVPAYSTTHEVAVVSAALKESTDLVILQITLNDAEKKPYIPTGITADMTDRYGAFQLDDKSPAIYRYWRTAAFVMSRLHNSRSYSEYKKYFPRQFERAEQWREYTGALKSIKKECEERSVPLVAVVFPLFGLAIDDGYPFTELHKKIGANLESLGIPHLDLLELYRGIPVERLQVIPGADRHGNEIAHRMAAERIYLWLEEKNLIPAELRIKARFSERLGITKRGALPVQERAESGSVPAVTSAPSATPSPSVSEISGSVP